MFTISLLVAGFALMVGFILIIPFIVCWSFSIPYLFWVSTTTELTKEHKDKLLTINSFSYIYIQLPFKTLCFNIGLLNFKRPITLFFTTLYNATLIYILYKIFQFITWFLNI